MTRFLALSRFALPGLAAALLVGLVLEFALADSVDDRALLIVLGTVGGLGLLLVSRQPFVGPLVATLAMASCSAVDPVGFEDLTTPFFVILLSAWCFGAYNRPRLAALGLTVVLGAALFVVLRFEEGSVTDVPWIFGFVLAAWLAGFAVRHQAAQTQRLRELTTRLRERQEQRAEEAVEAERNRIARELHDVVAHHVSVMTVQAGAVRRLLLPEQEREREALTAVEETGRKALTEMRRLLGVLKDEGGRQPAPRAPQPGVATLDTLLDQIREAGLPVELSTEGAPVELPPGVDLSAYRIVQEALTNVLKYAGPARAWVVVRYGERDLEVEVTNDGRNGGDQAEGGAHGLVGMRERVAVYGGELQSGPRPGGGFAVRARLPIETEAP